MRTAYLLTIDEKSPRAQFSKKTLENIGFNVLFVQALKHKNKVLSNKYSMMTIYDYIQNGNEEWAYVFEDDINVVEPIYLEEIMNYECISEYFFYLGCCIMSYDNISKSSLYAINNHNVYNIQGGVRGLHAIGISKKGAKSLLEIANSSNEIYMDCVLEKFSIKYPANIVRFDLLSPQEKDHRGILFQDRNRFPSTIVNNHHR